VSVSDHLQSTREVDGLVGELLAAGGGFTGGQERQVGVGVVQVVQFGDGEQAVGQGKPAAGRVRGMLGAVAGQVQPLVIGDGGPHGIAGRGGPDELPTPARASKMPGHRDEFGCHHGQRGVTGGVRHPHDKLPDRKLSVVSLACTSQRGQRGSVGRHHPGRHRVESGGSLVAASTVIAGGVDGKQRRRPGWAPPHPRPPLIISRSAGVIEGEQHRVSDGIPQPFQHVEQGRAIPDFLPDGIQVPLWKTVAPAVGGPSRQAPHLLSPLDRIGICQGGQIHQLRTNGVRAADDQRLAPWAADVQQDHGTTGGRRPQLPVGGRP
jgi:hypothetical protein